MKDHPADVILFMVGMMQYMYIVDTMITIKNQDDDYYRWNLPFHSKSYTGMPNASGSMNRQTIVSSLTTFRRSQPPLKEPTHQQDKVATINSHSMKAQQLLQPNEASK